MESDREPVARYHCPSHSLGPDNLPNIHTSEELGRKRNAGVCEICVYPSPYLIYILQLSHCRLYTAMTLSMRYNQSENVVYN